MTEYNSTSEMTTRLTSSRSLMTPVYTSWNLVDELSSEKYRRLGLPTLRWRLLAKRALDIVMSACLLLLVSPVFVATSLAIKMDTGGPILFQQSRRGRNGAIFKIYKFRTMYAASADKEAAVQTQVDDPRVTRVGAFLRKYSIDELPQLLNVIRGDMSLVGPRPHALGTSVNGVLLPDLFENYSTRYQVRPGMTGLAQVSGLRGQLDSLGKARARIEYDLRYIVEWSIRLDLSILMRTCGLVLQAEHHGSDQFRGLG